MPPRLWHAHRCRVDTTSQPARPPELQTDMHLTAFPCNTQPPHPQLCRVLFDIAITTTYSPGGMQQFNADCAAAMAAFAPFTAKPAAHFRNVCSVLRILQLDAAAAAEVAARMNEAHRKADSAELRRLVKSTAGAGSLTEHQVYRLLTATRTW
jgi:hypothetical protein